MVGLSFDAATYSVTQGSAEAEVRLDIRPDAILQGRLSGSTTSGTALTLLPVTTATTDGLDVTTGSEWSSPTYDSGAVWGYDGANKGQVRKITSVSSTAGTVILPFDYDHQVGDNFLRAPIFPMDVDSSATITLTSDFTEVDASAAVATNTALFTCIELITNTIDTRGTTNSYVLMVPGDHYLSRLS
jgi:hypothetical protein